MLSFLRAAACVAAVALPCSAHAQSADETTLRSAVETLFTAMRNSDTASVRAAFMPTARVMPMPAAATTPAQNALNVDAFVRFAGNNAPGTWNERVWDPRALVDGTLGHLWFEYDIVRNGATTQCGINSVQLQLTPAGWKILSMAFNGKSASCKQR
jgi:hypothetical protein